MTFQEFLGDATPKQRLIFCKALQHTAPKEVPSEQKQEIADDITSYSEMLTENDLFEVNRAVKILIEVEGFPYAEEQTVIDFLQTYTR
tara:strand:- start:3055 stop:3318 length:264 start_codon:yes stop_codon:yes gene_type:complete